MNKPDDNGNIEGHWEDCPTCNGRGEMFVPGVAVTHTEVDEPWVGPAYCRECSRAAQDWVRWPCPGSGEVKP